MDFECEEDLSVAKKRRRGKKRGGKTQEQQTRLFTSLNKIQDDISTRKFVCSLHRH